ncbi:MAG: hypothetical protein LBL76_05165, partial [Treponema sp.]|nr:hypothetical protein [Treponema sp.]
QNHPLSWYPSIKVWLLSSFPINALAPIASSPSLLYQISQEENLLPFPSFGLLNLLIFPTSRLEVPMPFLIKNLGYSFIVSS